MTGKNETTPTWPTLRMFSEIRIRLEPDDYTSKYFVEGKTRGFFSRWVILARIYIFLGEQEIALRRAEHAANHFWENHS